MGRPLLVLFCDIVTIVETEFLETMFSREISGKRVPSALSTVGIALSCLMIFLPQASSNGDIHPQPHTLQDR